jgi:predicted kinase
MDVAGLVAQLRRRFGWEGPAPPGSRRALILLSGLPGTGKSYLAAAIAARHAVVIVRSDEVRKALFEHPTYAAEESGVVYRTCHGLLSVLLAQGKTVIFDATNLARGSRKVARRVAGEGGAPTLTLLTVAAPEVVAERLRRRAAGELEGFSSDADWQVYQYMAGTLEAAQHEASEGVIVDTAQDITPALERVEAFLRAAPSAYVPAPGGQDGHA